MTSQYISRVVMAGFPLFFLFGWFALPNQTHAAADKPPFLPNLEARLGHPLPKTEPSFSVKPAPKTVPNEFVVKLKTSPEALKKSNKAFQGFDFVPLTPTGSKLGNYYKVVLPQQKDFSITQSLLQSSSTVEAVAPNNRVSINSRNVPNDPYYPNQRWYYDLVVGDNNFGISAPEAWDVTTGSSSVVVAVIDSGVDTDHPDLADNIWANPGETAGNSIDDDGNGYVDDVQGWDFVEVDSNNAPADNDPNPEPDGEDNDGDGLTDGGVTHGTHVAGIIAAEGDNGVGVAGVTWSTKIMPLRMLDDEGYGVDAELISALAYAVDNGADIINLSLGGADTSATLEAAFADAHDAGLVVVAAAGNDAADLNQEPAYPACYDGVIGVAATMLIAELLEIPAYFSNYGSDCVDIAAPGDYIYSTLYTDDLTYGFTVDYDYLSGTSMASPMVAGLAALILAQDPTLSPDDVATYIRDSADDHPFISAEYSGRRINAFTAVSAFEADVSAPTTINAWSDSTHGGCVPPGSFGDPRTDNVNAATCGPVADGVHTLWTAPYFSWSGGTVGPDVNYYVYFGTDADANPRTEGEAQSEYFFEPGELTDDEGVYYFRIRTERNGTFSDTASFTYIVDSEVREPEGLVGQADGDKNIITWSIDDDVFDDYGVGFNLYRSTEADGEYTLLDDTLTTEDDTYKDTDVVDGVNYFYRLMQVDDVLRESEPVQIEVEYNKPEWIVTGAGPGGGPHVRTFSSGGVAESQFFAYGSSFRGGVRVASCDLNSDGSGDIVTGAGPGGGPQVRTFNKEGEMILSPGFLAYDGGFRGGVYVACGDVDGDGKPEIVTAAGKGGSAHIRIFDRLGQPKEPTRGFYAYDEKFRGGATVAVGDLDGDGVMEIITGAGPGGGPQVAVFDGAGTRKLTTGFYAFPDAFRGGVNVAAADVDGDDKDDIIAAAGAGGGAHIRMFDSAGTPIVAAGGQMEYESDFRGGLFVGAINVDQDGTSELLVGPGGGRQPLVKIVNAATNANMLGEGFFAYTPAFSGGVSVASLEE